jgi:hypothetical protein
MGTATSSTPETSAFVKWYGPENNIFIKLPKPTSGPNPWILLPYQHKPKKNKGPYGTHASGTLETSVLEKWYKLQKKIWSNLNGMQRGLIPGKP